MSNKAQRVGSRGLKRVLYYSYSTYCPCYNLCFSSEKHKTVLYDKGSSAV